MIWLKRWFRLKDEDPRVPGLAELEERIGYTFADKSQLVRALRHRSYVYHALESQIAANGGTPGDHSVAELMNGPEHQANERLEFLGDAVLGLATTAFLYNRFPDKPEGELTKRKSVLVSKSVLARRAIEIGLDKHLLLSDLEESAGGRRRRSILGDAFEALLGAMFLDGGLGPCTRFLDEELFAHVEELTQDETYINYKSLLLEHVQAFGQPPPEYHLREQAGPDHRKTFTVEAVVGGEVLGHGVGRSKKDAQQSAAKEAYERLTGIRFANGNAPVAATDASPTEAHA